MLLCSHPNRHFAENHRIKWLVYNIIPCIFDFFFCNCWSFLMLVWSVVIKYNICNTYVAFDQRSSDLWKVRCQNLLVNLNGYVAEQVESFLTANCCFTTRLFSDFAACQEPCLLLPFSSALFHSAHLTVVEAVAPQKCCSWAVILLLRRYSIDAGKELKGSVRWTCTN